MLEAKCAFGIVTLVAPALKAIKIIEAADSATIIASLPDKMRPFAQFLYDLYHARFLKDAPAGYQTPAEVISKLRSVKTAHELLKVMPELARAIANNDYGRLATDLADIAGLKACIQGVKLATSQ